MKHGGWKVAGGHEDGPPGELRDRMEGFARQPGVVSRR